MADTAASVAADRLKSHIKIGLDETRLLMLGASLLLGFQFGAPFLDNFAALSPLARGLDGAALLLTALSVGLLVLPSAFHRIAEQGDVSLRMRQLTSVATGLALVPFASATGINAFIIAELLGGRLAGIIAAAATFVTAAWFWFGLMLVRRHGRQRGTHMDEVCETPSLTTRIDQMLIEARVMLPGVQALLAFQLSIALTKAFEALPGSSKAAHAIALGLICLAMILLVAPAAYHRLVCDGDSTEDMLRIGSRFVTVSTLPLALGLALDAYVVIAHIAGSAAFGVTSGLATLLVLLTLWLGVPLLARRHRRTVAS